MIFVKLSRVQVYRTTQTHPSLGTDRRKVFSDPAQFFVAFAPPSSALYWQVTFYNLTRYSSYHKKIFARRFATAVDCITLNKAAIIRAVPPNHEQALVLEAHFVPKSSKHTYGFARY
jgi:hypothetical protein